MGGYEIPAIREQWIYWLFLSNYHQPRGEYVGSFWLGHFWSMAVEMQFYFFWPVALVLMEKRQLRLFLLVCLLLAPVLRAFFVLNSADWTVTFGWTPMRMDGLMIGSLIALYMTGGFFGAPQNRHILLIGFLVSFAVLISVSWYGLSSAVFKHPNTTQIISLRILLPSIVSMVFGYLLYYSIRNKRIIGLFSMGVLRTLGKYSYSLYVFHYLFMPMFILKILPLLEVYFEKSSDMTSYVFFLITSSTAFLLSLLTYLFIERPALILKRYFPLSI